MKNRLRTAAALFPFLLLSCQSDEPNTEPVNDLEVTTADEPAGENCAAGGKRIEITQGGETSTVYVCHGLDGDRISVSDAGEQCLHGGSVIQVDDAEPIFVCNGKDGTSAEAVVMDAIDAGEDCTYGGVSLRVGHGEPFFICNGAPGETGADGKSVAIATEPAGANCEYGGIAVKVGANGDPTYVCNGAPGEKGEGVTLSIEPAGENCARGGVKMQVGGDIRYVCHGDALTWHELTANADAQPNAGYVARGSSDLTLTLPATGNLRMGDVVRVVNTSTGTVSVTPHEGQSFRYAPGVLEVPTTFFPRAEDRFWYDCAASADGSTLLAAYRVGLPEGNISISTDGGMTWQQRAPEERPWYAVATSADGTKLFAAIGGGQVYTSTDFGESWTPTSDHAFWYKIASSTDGVKVVAVINGGRIHISSDSGQTWTPRGPTSPHYWSSVATSADGSKIIASSSLPGAVFTSTDSGQTWTQRLSGEHVWTGSASSADGTRLVAVGRNTQILVSSDGGLTWNPRGPTREWIAAASSADGTKLIAAAEYDRLYISTDSGLTWTPRGPEARWRAAAVSADGSRFIANILGGHIYVSEGTGSLVARGHSLVELTYTGNGEFFVSDVQGTVEKP